MTTGSLTIGPVSEFSSTPVVNFDKAAILLFAAIYAALPCFFFITDEKYKMRYCGLWTGLSFDSNTQSCNIDDAFAHFCDFFLHVRASIIVTERRFCVLYRRLCASTSSHIYPFVSPAPITMSSVCITSNSLHLGTFERAVYHPPSGLTFGFGLAIGGMVRPNTVREALSPQTFDPTLWILFVSALVTTFLLFVVPHSLLCLDYETAVGWSWVSGKCG